jgi:(p)ppGpp synthase/HD superfamily hydrolase
VAVSTSASSEKRALPVVTVVMFRRSQSIWKLKPWDDKHPKAERSRAYLEHLRTADRSVLLVSASDKLYNARSIVKDLRVHGDALWERFSGTRDETLARYRDLVDAYRSNPASNRELVDELERVVTEMHRLAGL